MSYNSANRDEIIRCTNICVELLVHKKSGIFLICKELKFKERLMNLFTRRIVCLYLGHFSLIKIKLTLCKEKRDQLKYL